MLRCPRRLATDGRSSTTPRVRGELAPTWNSVRRYWSVSKERRLGRGLEALLGRSFEAQSQDAPVQEQQYESFEAAPQFDSSSYQSHASIDENVTRSGD